MVRGYDPARDVMVLSVPPNVKPKRVSVDAIEHWMIYREHPEVGAILHVHGWIDGTVSTDVNYPCGTVQLASSVADLVRAAPDPSRAVVGLRNHGLTITGHSLDDIFDRVGDAIVPRVPDVLRPHVLRLTGESQVVVRTVGRMMQRIGGAFVGVLVLGAVLAGCVTPVTPSVTFTHSTFEGFPVISYVPDHPVAMIYLFHGSNGSADFAEKVETTAVLNAFIARGLRLRVDVEHRTHRRPTLGAGQPVADDQP